MSTPIRQRQDCYRENLIPRNGACILADAASTGLPDGCADTVIGEAMLSMQGQSGKSRIVGEAFRLLRPGGTYSIHELGLHPDDLDQSTKDVIRTDLARAIKVNARPLTEAEWKELLEQAGFDVVWTAHSPMALLKLGRNLSDEGVTGEPQLRRRLHAEEEGLAASEHHPDAG
ncbi:MAG: hypothetical protein LKF35_04640 [Bifidobacterium minimum]|nr:hypothetical protein [Bifidobacterium minimum]